MKFNKLLQLLIILFCLFSNSSQAGVIKTITKTIPKILFKYGDDVIKLTSKYADDAAKFVSKYGDDAGKIISKYGDDGVIVLQKYGDDAIKMTKKYGPETSELLMKYGDDAISVSKKYGKNGLQLLEKNSVLCKTMTKINSPVRLFKTVSKFSEKGITTTGSLLVKLKKSNPKNVSKFVDFIQKFGEKGSQFIWKQLDTGLKIVGNNKVASVIVAMVAYGFAHPEDVEAGMKLSKDAINHAVTTTGKVINDLGKNAINKSGTVVQKTVSNSYILQIAIACILLLFTLLLFYKIGLIPTLSKLKSSESSDTTEKNEPPSWV